MSQLADIEPTPPRRTVLRPAGVEAPCAVGPADTRPAHRTRRAHRRRPGRAGHHDRGATWLRQDDPAHAVRRSHRAARRVAVPRRRRQRPRDPPLVRRGRARPRRTDRPGCVPAHQATRALDGVDRHPPARSRDAVHAGTGRAVPRPRRVRPQSRVPRRARRVGHRAAVRLSACDGVPHHATDPSHSHASVGCADRDWCRRPRDGSDRIPNPPDARGCRSRRQGDAGIGGTDRRLARGPLPRCARAPRGRRRSGRWPALLR